MNKSDSVLWKYSENAKILRVFIAFVPCCQGLTGLAWHDWLTELAHLPLDRMAPILPVDNFKCIFFNEKLQN